MLMNSNAYFKINRLEEWEQIRELVEKSNRKKLDDEKRKETVLSKRDYMDITKYTYTKYKEYAEEILFGLNIVNLFPFESEFSFLDIGFAPGGISMSILDMFRNSNGTGLSLPIEEGGNPISEKLKDNKRYKIILQDIQEPENVLSSIQNKKYDLVILDVSYHGDVPKVEKEKEEEEEERKGEENESDDFEEWETYMYSLYQRQLILGLNALKPGGHIIMRTNLCIDTYNFKLHHWLLYNFKFFNAYKPCTKFPISKTFYILLKDFKYNDRTNKVLESLEYLHLNKIPTILEMREWIDESIEDVKFDLLNNFYSNMIYRSIKIMKEYLKGKKLAMCKFKEKCKYSKDDDKCQYAHNESDCLSSIVNYLKRIK